jgi:hypothetical protein
LVCAQLAPGKGTANIQEGPELAKNIPKTTELIVFLQNGDKYFFSLLIISIEIQLVNAI